MAKEIKDRDKVTMRPLKWKCTNECRKLTSEEVAIVLKTNSLFQKSIEDLRAGLDALEKNSKVNINFFTSCFNTLSVT